MDDDYNLRIYIQKHCDTPKDSINTLTGAFVTICADHNIPPGTMEKILQSTLIAYEDLIVIKEKYGISND